MNNRLLNLLMCPICLGSLEQKKKGCLVCKKCKEKYTIHQGIPIIINNNNLNSHLVNQVKYFDNENKDRLSYTLSDWQKRYLDNYLNYGKPKPHGLIIDNATGSGYMGIELAKIGYTVIATDLTFSQLSRLNEIKHKLKLKNYYLVCCSSEELPFKNNIADGMCANAILEHLPDETKAISEITRILKIHASLLLAMPIKFLYVWPFLWLINYLHDRRIGHLRRYSRLDILTKFTQFKEIYTYYTGHLMKVFCLLMNIITKKKYWNLIGERYDEKIQAASYGASNIVMILKKI